MRISVFTVVFFSVFLLCAAEKMLAGIYPDMRDFKLTAPENYKPLGMEDLRIDAERIRSMREIRPVPATREQLLKAAEFFRDDPDGRDFWRRHNAAHVLKYVNSWSLPKVHHPAYQVRWLRLEPVIETYFFTGNPVVGRFIRDYTLHAMTLDKWFWMGQVLRPYRRNGGKQRYADLHTLPFAQVLNALLSRCRELFSAEELELIESKYREYVLESCHDDLLRRKGGENNWNAILNGALLLSAKYFGDEPKAQLAVRRLKQYFDRQIESDGSYGEGVGYGMYALSVLPAVLPYLTQEERNEFFRGSSLKKLPEWVLYHDFRSPGKFYRTAFADDNYFSIPLPGVMYVLALAYEDPVAAYLGSRTRGRKPWWNNSVRSYLIGGGRNPETADPKTLGLPLFRHFSNGEAFMRSGWKTEDAVFACWLGLSCRVNSHRRPESGNFMFGYNGIPIVMHSGNTNLYRRPIHRLSIRTSAANTVTIDGEDQIPGNLQNVRYLEFLENEDMMLIRCDLRTAYRQPMKKMIRTFAWLKSKKSLVVMDQLESAEGSHRYRAHLHLNNIFHNAVLSRKGMDLFLYRHPRASLYIRTNGEADVSKGYVVSERFSNWDEVNQQKEADRGNALTLSYGPSGKTAGATLWAVLGEKDAEVLETSDGLWVSGVFLPFF